MDANMMFLKEKKHVGNCIAWDVYEGLSCKIGIAVMPLAKNGMPSLPFENQDFRPFLYSFGKEELLGIGDFNLTSESKMRDLTLIESNNLPWYFKGLNLLDSDESIDYDDLFDILDGHHAEVYIDSDGDFFGLDYEDIYDHHGYGFDLYRYEYGEHGYHSGGS